ncbi:MAG TPA: MoaD/ThiS family protein [Opitutaceae bacterium]|nr:MoaD/ThiS family protein [Opitutaceae bacterium]
MSAKIEITVPGLLADCLGGKRRASIEAESIEGAIGAMLKKFPLLKPHIYDDTGAQRQHVLLFFNGENLAWIKDRTAPVRDGDRLDVIQAVSGG